MPFRIELLQSWTPERVVEALPSIIECAKRIVAEHPDEMTLGSLFHAVMSGNTLLWIVFDEDEPNVAVLTVYTTLRHYTATGITFVEITGIAGDQIHDALHLLDEIEEWAVGHDAQKIIVKGREGWVKLLKDRGYRKVAVVLEKEI
jgi:hypothetical protein